jgi:DNA-binding transcriptional ArsR family regulator
MVVSWEPVRAALVSLALLTDDVLDADADAWVAQTATQLSAEQRLRNRVVFERFGGALLAALEAPDFPAYLDALARVAPSELQRRVGESEWSELNVALAREVKTLWQDALALRAYLVAHLRDMWETHLETEWDRHAQKLRGLTSALKPQATGLTGAAADVTRSFVRRDLPEWALAQLGGVNRVVFVLSPHAPLYVDRFGEANTAYVFAQFDNQMMRSAPLQRAEVLGSLTALADDTRLRLLELLAANGEMRAQELIAELGASQPNVSRHLKQLVGAGLVDERRAGDANKLYRLRTDCVRPVFYKLAQLLSADNARASVAHSRRATMRMAALATYPIEVRPFLDERGRVTHFSTKLKEQRPVLDYLIAKFEPGHSYTEAGVTELIGRWLAEPNSKGLDAVTLRRALVDEGDLHRAKDGSRYWREAK